MKLSLFCPVKPKSVNQGFGLNPVYYKKFGLNGHNGLDLKSYHGQPVYAAHDGNAFWEIDKNQGEGVVLRTSKLYDYDSPQYSEVYYKTIYWHLCDGVKEPHFASPVWLEFSKTNAGVPVKAGDLIGYADNTGFPYESSGDHLHFGLKPQLPNEPNEDWYNVQQNNGYLGAIDPTPYFNGLFAEDINSISIVPSPDLNTYQKIIAILKKVVELYKQLLWLK